MRALLAIALAACSANEATVQSAATSCGMNTHEENGVCVPDVATVYTVRSSSKIVANETSTRVFVFGRRPDGTVATDKIVLNTNRANAGTFDPPTLDLGELHSFASFTPCSATVPGCTGPLVITAALASAPTTPIASFPVELVATPAIGTLAPCLVGGNVLHIEGKTYMHRGTLTVTNGTFTRAGGTHRGEVVVVPTNPMQGSQWTVEFSTVQLGTALVPGVYNAGMNLRGEHPASNCAFSFHGEYQIHDFVYTTSVQRLTATFRQWCGSSTPPTDPHRIVTGCIHVE